MGEYFEVKFNNDEVIGKLTELSKKFSNLTPFLKIIRVKLLYEIEQNFLTEGKSSGEKWKDWSERYKKYRIKHFGGGQILSRSGELRRSFTSILEKKKLTIGTAKEYAAIHNFGHDGKNMPQREFFRFSETSMDELLEDLNNHAKEILEAVTE